MVSVTGVLSALKHPDPLRADMQDSLRSSHAAFLVKKI